MIMNKLYFAARRFWTEEKGVTAIEYGLIAGLIAVVIILALTNVGTQLNLIFEAIVTKLTAVPKT
jgi:pilus assembly protein Flp/PilA